jgi:hypothetical protein
MGVPSVSDSLSTEDKSAREDGMRAMSWADLLGLKSGMTKR